MPEMKASPRSSVLGMIADALTKARETGNRANLPILGGLGDLLIGKVPDEINEWSYGNAPLRVTGGGTGSLIPQLKQGRAESLADTVLNGPGMGQAVRAAPKILTGALNRMAENSAPMLIRQAGAVKPRGGNWLYNDGLRWLEDLQKNAPGIRNLKSQEQLNFEAANPAYGALNKWVRGPLTNYTKRDLGTATDPLLDLADQGIFTADANTLLDPQRWMLQNARANREAGGFNKLGLVDTGGYKKGWEDLTDAMVQPFKKKEIEHNLGPYLEEFKASEPGFDKIPADAVVHQFAGDEAPYHLGFDTLTNMLERGLTQHEGLPPGLRLKPEDLQQMGMEKAVRYMHDVRNFDKATEKEATLKAMEAAGKQGKLIKEYPTGHRLVDLMRPEALDEQMMSSIRQNADGTFSPVDGQGNIIKRMEMMNGRPVDVKEYTPEDAYLGGMLANEGNLMQHCVGGYCDDVSKGYAKIYSVRDAKGEPHVTIEALPGGQYTQEQYNEVLRAAKDMGYPTDEQAILEQYNMLPPGKETPARITQIFGKQNTAPKDEYLPVIQDFIRSGNYRLDDEVAKNAGLIPYKGRYVTQEELKPLLDVNNGPVDYDAIDAWQTHVIDNGNIQFKDGGLIEDNDFAMPGHF